MYSEMNVPLEENSIFYGSIKNIGSQDVNVSCSAEGINQIGITFDPISSRVNQGNVKKIKIFINTIGAHPGGYKGWFYIWNNKTQETLEKIPLTISVNNSSKSPRQSI